MAKNSHVVLPAIRNHYHSRINAGGDVGTPLYTGVAMALAMTGTAVGGIRFVAGRSVDRRKRTKST